MSATTTLHEDVPVRPASTVVLLRDGDDGLQTLQPLVPTFLRDVLIDPDTELTRIGWFVEAFGFHLEHYALNHTRHINRRLATPWSLYSGHYESF